MKITPDLKRKMKKAISVSMQIEGYSGTITPERKLEIKQLMEAHNIKLEINLQPEEKDDTENESISTK